MYAVVGFTQFSRTMIDIFAHIWTYLVCKYILSCYFCISKAWYISIPSLRGLGIIFSLTVVRIKCIILSTPNPSNLFLLSMSAKWSSVGLLVAWILINWILIDEIYVADWQNIYLWKSKFCLETWIHGLS